MAAPGFLLGDTDPDGDAVVATSITDNVDHGTLVAFPDGHFTYTSNVGYVGLDSFTYRISDGFGGFDEGRVTIDVINQNPVADDDSYSARPGQALAIAAPGFLLGDTDPDGDAVVATSITDNVDHGTLVAFPDGHFTYTSNVGYVGLDSFTYRISDGFGGFDEGRVTIDVINQNPVADDDSYSARPGQALAIAAPGFLLGDTDPDGDAVVATSITDTVDHGTLVAFPDGHFTYTSNVGYVGLDSFVYRISDGFGGFDEGRVTIDVTNRAPVADDDVYSTAPGVVLAVAAPGFLLGDADPDGDAVVATSITDNVDHGTLTAFPDGHFSYTPDLGFVGIDSFAYRITDGFGGTDDGLVTIHVGTDPVLQTLRIGDAPVRQTGLGGQWQAAWTLAGIDILHKADHASLIEPWSPVALHGASSAALSGGDIYQGDLGVSGTSIATSAVVTELDGRQALRFELGQPGLRVGLQLARLFGADDGTAFAESGLLRLLDAAGGLVAEKVFRADGSAAGTLQVSLDAPAPFVAVELLAGAYDGGSFVHGAYANADGSFGSTAFVGVDGAWHGSDFMVDWIEFDVPL
ncbi:MAG: Ig-like domain-containing protein [Rubrivivax sp.]